MYRMYLFILYGVDYRFLFLCSYRDLHLYLYFYFSLVYSEH